MTRLSRIVLLLRDIEHGVRFYRDGLGLQLERQTESYARLMCPKKSNSPVIELNAADSESQCTTGYSPLLTFEVDDMDALVPRLMDLGAALDGSIRYEAYGKVAAVRSPDGQMIGLYEPANLPNDGDTAVAAAAAAQAHLRKEPQE